METGAESAGHPGGSLMADAFGAHTFGAVDDAELRTRSRADFVYERLREAISDGRIAGGERVREEEVARNLGVSRTPVR
jgi:DNA-binding GntR family transcriptional regulator